MKTSRIMLLILLAGALVLAGCTEADSESDPNGDDDTSQTASGDSSGSSSSSDSCSVATCGWEEVRCGAFDCPDHKMAERMQCDDADCAGQLTTYGDTRCTISTTCEQESGVFVP